MAGGSAISMGISMADIPVADKRSKQDVLEEIIQKAATYTPEWRFDSQEPDVGTALALVFADMYYKTLQQYNKVAYKSRNEFFNCLHASLKTAVPATGYVTFGLVNNTVEGVELRGGSALTTDAVSKDGQRIPIETKDDIYVSPAEICSIFESYDKYDYIGEIYEKEEKNKGFRLFDFHENNLQNHKFLISHTHVLSLKQSGVIEITLYGRNRQPFSKEVLKELCDKKNVVCSYSCETGFSQFERQYVKGNKLCLEKGLNQPPVLEVSYGNQNGCWIQWDILNYQAVEKATGGLAIEDMYLASKNNFIRPDCVNANGIDCDLGSYFPFGEQFGIYNEVYFVCEEVFRKKGAMIELSFHLNFEDIPLDFSLKDSNIDWKLIMPKGTFKEIKEYDITIEEVVWEYFNGNGWVRLFKGKEYSDVFKISNGIREQDKVITFICPNDISIAYVGGGEYDCIRARILKVNNGYKTNAKYISPFMEDTRVRFEYLEGGEQPEWFYISNNLQEELFRAQNCLNKMECFYPFKQAGDKVPTIYIGTKQPFLEGPLRMLWMIDHSGYEKKPSLFWEYYSEGRWNELNVADETENFRKTGLITFSGCDDSAELKMFGKELYWIRIRDLQCEYEKNKNHKKPFILGIHMNSVKVQTIRSDYKEYFTLNDFLENFKCSLIHENIYAYEVWVKEKEFSENPDMGWVQWESVEGLSNSGPEDKHYVMDSNTGTIRFGDNKHGKIPTVGLVDSILVKYSVGGGTETNLNAGKITGLDLAAGYINQVNNPIALSGGYDKETVTEAIKRCEGEIKHQFYAVTVDDYEKLSLSASGNIERVKCFSGYNSDGVREFGQITLVLLKKDYIFGGIHFFDLKERVYFYLKDKMNPNIIKGNKLHIVQPKFVTIQVVVEASVIDYSLLFDSREKILSELEQFLDPVKGNFSGKGWGIGRLPKYNQISNILNDSKGNYQIRSLSISCFIEKNNLPLEVELEVISRHPFVLPLNGKHKIKLVQAGGGSYVT